jgi:threonine dehydrogenase-like Zn-dependent dehydrogenase/glycosyltransferase involved in cell wall biosynthesis
MPRTSIIVRCFNEARHLPALFDAFDQQTDRDFEVLLIDSGSFDASREIAERRGARILRIPKHDFTFGYSLNVGIEAGDGRFMAIVSAHAIPTDAHWLERLTAPLEDDAVAMTYGRQVGVASSKFSEAEDFDRVFGPNARTEKPTDFRVNNANSAIRKADWQEFPFDEELTGLEDIAYARYWMAKGRKVLYLPEPAVFHIHEESWRQVRNRYYREAVALRHLGLKGPKDAPKAVLDEFLCLIGDHAAVLTRRENPVTKRLTFGQRLREVIYFRYQKAMGTATGYTRREAMRTRREREDLLFDRSGRAVVIEGPGRATIENRAIPPVRPGEVLIRVTHAGVSAADMQIFDGVTRYAHSGATTYPIVPGHEVVGEIAVLGQNAGNLAENQPVVVQAIHGCGTCDACRGGNVIACPERTEVGVRGIDGGYGDFMVAPARFVHHVPKGLDPAIATLAEPLAVVLKGLRRIGITGGGRGPLKSAAVLGGGPLGQLAALTLRRYGLEVTAIDRNPARRAILDAAGITSTEESGQLATVDLVVEATGDSDVLDRAIAHSRQDATILMLGLPYLSSRQTMSAIAACDRIVVGSVGCTDSDFRNALALLPLLDLAPLTVDRRPLEAYREAWGDMREGRTLKVVLEPGAAP